MAADTVKIQGNVDRDLAKRVNKMLHLLGINADSIN